MLCKASFKYPSGINRMCHVPLLVKKVPKKQIENGKYSNTSSMWIPSIRVIISNYNLSTFWGNLLSDYQSGLGNILKWMQIYENHHPKYCSLSTGWYNSQIGFYKSAQLLKSSLNWTERRPKYRIIQQHRTNVLHIELVHVVGRGECKPSWEVWQVGLRSWELHLGLNFSSGVSLGTGRPSLRFLQKLLLFKSPQMQGV